MKFSYYTSLVFTFYHSNRFDKKCIYVLNLTSPRYSLDFFPFISLCSLCLYTLDYRGHIPLGVLFHLYQYLIANLSLVSYFSDQVRCILSSKSKWSMKKYYLVLLQSKSDMFKWTRNTKHYLTFFFFIFIFRLLHYSKFPLYLYNLTFVCLNASHVCKSVCLSVCL